MRAKFINEKFTKDSDPIEDMRIGSKDILGDAREKLAKGKKIYPTNFTKAYRSVFDYLNTFKGKTINGIFTQSGKVKEYTFKIYRIATYKGIQYMVITDEKRNEYRVIEGERYIFY